MAVTTISTQDAVNALKKNPLAKYPKSDTEHERLYPIAQPQTNMSFTLREGEKVFTIGSCFARNIEKHLKKLGFELPTMEWLEYKKNDLEAPNEFLNKYVTLSMLNELRWALDPSTPFPGADALIEVSKDKWFDPHSAPTVPLTSLEQVMKRREKVSEITRQIKQSRIVTVTLGLVEAWYDKQTELYLNAPPPWGYLLKNKDRYELRVLDYNEIIQSLEETYKLLQQYGHYDFHMLITVSPVPLVNTFTETDVLQANCYSKSVLRAAAETFWRQHDNVDYFPSYESVTLSHHELAWEDDNRHVKPDIVGNLMATMAMSYVPGNEKMRAYREFCLGKMYHDLNHHKDAIEHFTAAQDINPKIDGLAYFMAMSYYRTANYAAAKEAFLNASKNDNRAWFWLALTCKEFKDFEEAEKYITRSITQNDQWAAAHYHHAVILKALKQFSQAIEAANRALALNAGFKEAAALKESLESAVKAA